MTRPRQPSGRAAGSQVAGIAAPDPANRWCVNLNNGNTNELNDNNTAFARAVRAGECDDAVSFHALHAAWREASRGKQPSRDQLAFDSTWIDGLFDLQERLRAGIWCPSPATCFIAAAPKAREIHAPAFADRVVHHWLVPQLEAIYEPSFIHDSYANRRGKGTHAAVARLRQFLRQVESGQGGGWYLQLDIRNFFNRIHRPTLYALLKPRIARLSLPARRATHALLARPIAASGVIQAASAADRALVPPYKRLENAPPGCGIAIGNLSSQFFANVYMNELDQFVKRTLRVPRYLRYVDDFILVHRDREQLLAWHGAIAAFLAACLWLELKPDPPLRPLTAGIDFLGYVVYPHHQVVRRRVIGHCRAKLAAFECEHVRRGRLPADVETSSKIRAVWASYLGHFRHANSWRLRCRIVARFPWLERVA